MSYHSDRPLAVDPEAGRAYAPNEIQSASRVNNDTILPTSTYGGNKRSPATSSHEDDPDRKDKEVVDLATAPAPHEEEYSEKSKFTKKLNEFAHLQRPFLHAALIMFGLAFWICTIILNRDYWIPVTVIVWFFIALIVSNYLPTDAIAGGIGRTWSNTVEGPWFKLPYMARLAAGWVCLLALLFGSAFGFPLEEGTSYGQRAQSLFGLFCLQLGFYLTSRNRKAIQWRTIIVGLIFQQALAL